MLACDLVVAATNARLGLSEVGIGVIPTCAGLFRAPQSFPLNLARELILTEVPIGAERAYNAGFVNVLTEPGAALAEAVTLAQRFCMNAPLSVQACLASLNTRLEAEAELGWAATERAKSAIFGTDDAAEGVRSFVERRAPRWQSR